MCTGQVNDSAVVYGMVDGQSSGSDAVYLRVTGGLTHAWGGHNGHACMSVSLVRDVLGHQAILGGHPKE
jgi:hypothetical protein